MRVLFLLVAFAIAPVIVEPSVSSTPYTMRVVDGTTGRGISGLHVITDNGIVCLTSGNGAVRFTERSLMRRDVHFRIQDDTHQFDGGTNLRVTPGGQGTFSIHRTDNSTS